MKEQYLIFSITRIHTFIHYNLSQIYTVHFWAQDVSLDDNYKMQLPWVSLKSAESSKRFFK